jgi:Ca-activated chloride channel family protein
MLRRTLTAIAVSSFALATQAGAADRAIIVMDASGSMWGQIAGKTKIEIARETLSSVLTTIPADLELGLIAYGHREKGVCSDIEEIVAPGAGTQSAISGAVAKLNPKGKTPLTDAVRRAAESLKYTEDKATVILVTDGIETCNADPCAVAAELEKAGVDFTAHVVGFGLKEGEGAQVACIAENTGGTFLEAKDAAELSDALTKTVAAAPPQPAKPEPAPEPAAIDDNVTITAVLTEGGPDYDLNGRWDYFPLNGDTPAKKSIDGGYDTSFTTTLEPGRYLLRYKKDMATAETVVDVEKGERIKRDLVLDAGVVKVSVLPDDGAPVDTAARYDIHTADNSDGGYGSGVLVVPAGDLLATARLGEGEAEESFTLAAGEIVEKNIVMGIGLLNAGAVYAEGGPAVEDSGLRVDVLSAKKDLQGKQKNFTGGYGPGNQFKLPPGEYVLRARLQSATADTAVTVARGEAVDAVVNLNAGVLYVNVPGAYRIDVMAAKPDLQGKKQSFDGGYGEEHQTTLHPGDYSIVVKMGDNQGEVKEFPATVTAAERTEVKSP